MNGMMKFMLFVLMGLYVVSPVDLCPGPIDDLLVVVLTFAANKKLKPQVVDQDI